MLSQYRTRPEPPASQTPVTCGVCRPLRPQSIQDKKKPNPRPTLHTPYTPTSLRTLPDRNHFLIKICAFYTKKQTKLENEEEPEDFDEEVGRADQQSFISPSPLPPAFCSIFPALKPEIVPEVIVANLRRRSCVFSHGSQPKEGRTFVSF